MPRLCVLISAFCVLSLSACAYPRRSTPISELPREMARPEQIPSGLWQLEFISAEIPDAKRSGLPWDDDGGPDPFIKLFLDGRPIWESEVLRDSVHPQFNASLPRNLAFDRDKALARIELWDRDGIGNDPIGIYEGRALGSALVDAETLLKLEGGATLTLRVRPPVPHVGTGISLYEVRNNALVILKVMPNSPAARAGMKPGDRITAIGGRRVEDLGAQKAESGLALSIQNQTELTVTRGQASHVVTLDSDFIWLSL